MTSEWRNYTLDELYTISSGLSKKREEFGFGYPFLTFKEVFHNTFVPDILSELANTTDKERENCSIKRGDVFLTRTSEKLDELGLSSVALRNYPNATFNGFTKRLRPNEKGVELLDPEYVAFYLRSHEFRNQVTSFASMTTRASLNNEMISKLTIKVPPLAIQKQIARIMVNLLQKEESNKKTVHLLEEISQTLFKNWYVDFEFPNEVGLPYSSSGGNMVNSELGEIPDKWSIVEIKDIDVVVSDHVANGSFKSLKENVVVTEDENYALFLRNVDMKNGLSKDLRYVTKESYEFLKKSRLYGNEVIISNVGDVGTVHRCPSLKKPMVLGNNQIFIVSNKEDGLYNTFLYLFFRSGVGKHLIDSITSGSVQMKFNKTDLRNSKIVLPDECCIRRIEQSLNVHLDTIENLNFENKKLGELRDSLLPKLLSEEIHIPEGSVVG